MKTMINFIDASNWQSDMNAYTVLPNVDAIVCKATEGTNFVDGYCDEFIQAAISLNKPFGFYHFASDGNASDEAQFFYDNCLGYFGRGVPVLDWEGSQNVDWINEFVEKLHDLCGVWPWIYANPWRFNQGGVNQNCMRWIASYPAVTSPTFEDAASWDAPEADGLVGAWQFCSDGHIDSYSGDLDCSLFYGNESAWNAYAGVQAEPEPEPEPEPQSDVETLENDDYKITIERK